MEQRAFKWCGLGLATIACGMLIYLLNDMRLELRRTNAIVNQHLPQIVANVNTATATLANVSKDIESFRDLAGFANVPTDRSLVTYADSLLDFLEAQPGAQVGVTKLVGSGITDLVPAAAWVRAARKEALWLSIRASTKAELLDRISKTKFGSNWMFVGSGMPAMTLAEFLRSNHPDSKGL
jgi:hypothetical protein